MVRHAQLSHAPAGIGASRFRVRRALAHVHNDKFLVPAMACMSAAAGAVAMARKCGYAVMRPNGRQIRVDTKHLRCIPSEK